MRRLVCAGLPFRMALYMAEDRMPTCHHNRHHVRPPFPIVVGERPSVLMVYRLAYHLSEEDGGDDNGRYDAADVGQEACCNGVARLANPYGAEIDGQYVEGRVRCPLEDA